MVIVKIIRDDWPYAILTIGLLILWALFVSTYNTGFFTAWDEAYFLLKSKEAYEMSCITGKSQWNLIAIHWFPYLDLTSKFQSYVAAGILRFVTIIVATATCCSLFNKERVIKYFSIILLCYFYWGRDFGMSYVPMQMAVLNWTICSFLLFYNTDKEYLKYLFLFICGICLAFSVFIIITGALAVSACILGLLLILKWGEWKKIMCYVISGIVGSLFTLFYIHFFVCPISEIVKAMLFAASYISKSGHNYDAASFFGQYITFGRHVFVIILAYLGAFYLSKKISNKYLGAFVYCVLLLTYSRTQIVPFPANCLMLSSLATIPLVENISFFRVTKDILTNKTQFLILFLILFPVIAPLGTNTGVEMRAPNYVITWLIILFSFQDKEYYRLIIPIVLLMLFPIYVKGKIAVLSESKFHFVKGNSNFAEVRINKKQLQYLENIYSILSKYEYKSNQSVLFTPVFDYSTMYALDAVNSSNFYQPSNFEYFDKTKMIRPDFIILCQSDSLVIASGLREMDWGWPEDFDVYNIGTPEDESVSHFQSELEDRMLYCRKIGVRK